MSWTLSAPMQFDRRAFLAALAGAGVAAASTPAWAQGATGRTILYVAVGADLHAYSVDDNLFTLTHEGATKIPEAVQYIWFHPNKPLLYASFSNRYTSKSDDRHGVSVFAVDRQTGRLTAFGEPLTLRTRPVNITVDPAGDYLLVAYNQPSGLSVHRLGPDGAIGPEVQQSTPIEAGTYAHQVRVSPAGDLVVLSTRGNDATAKTPEDPGAFKVFHFKNGELTHETSVANGNGLGFGPRHVDFHPTKPWMLASMERNNELLVYSVDANGITPSPLFTKPTVERPDRKLPVQFVGPIHLHPNGRTVYLANRSDGTIEFAGKKVHGDGENTVAVFSLDATTGEPSLIQRIDTETFHVRTFTIHPSGKMLVTASVAPLDVRDGEQIRTVPAGLSVFAVAADGRLRFVRKYDVETGTDWMFWCGMVQL